MVRLVSCEEKMVGIQAAQRTQDGNFEAPVQSCASTPEMSNTFSPSPKQKRSSGLGKGFGVFRVFGFRERSLRF